VILKNFQKFSKIIQKKNFKLKNKKEKKRKEKKD